MKLTIIGASGQGKVVADVAEKNGYDDIEFLDDIKFGNPSFLPFCNKWPIASNTQKISSVHNDIFIAIGNSNARKLFMERYEDKHFPVLIHPDAVIADNVIIGIGSVIMAGAVINPSAKIGRGCIINTSSSVDHDCVVGDYTHIAVGSHVAGTVIIGSCTWIGAGATVSNNISICDDCMIGAGAVIVRDIKESGTYVGVPARKIK